MKTRCPMSRDAIRSIKMSSQKYIKSDLVEAFEKSRIRPYDISVFIEDKYKKIPSKLKLGMF